MFGKKKKKKLKKVVWNQYTSKILYILISFTFSSYFFFSHLSSSKYRVKVHSEVLWRVRNLTWYKSFDSQDYQLIKPDLKVKFLI